MRTIERSSAFKRDFKKYGEIDTILIGAQASINTKENRRWKNFITLELAL